MSGEARGTVEGMDVAYVAHLARLHLAPEEAVTFQRQLDEVIAYIHELKDLDVEGVEPTAHATAIRNVLREDVVVPGLDRAVVLRNAPKQADGQFMVPKILE